MPQIKFTRQEDLTLCYDLIINRENLFVVGNSGMGKSHLLKQLTAKLQGRRICFYNTLRGSFNMSAFAQKFTDELFKASNSHANVDYQLKRFINENPLYTITTWPQLIEWANLLKSVLEQISHDFLFIFEDIQEWGIEKGDYTNLEKILIALESAKNCHLLLSANNAFAKKHISKIKTKLIDIKAYPLEKIWSQPSETENELYHFTKGNTAFLIEMNNALEQNENNWPTAVHTQMTHYHHVLVHFKSRFTFLQWNLLCAIAVEDYVQQPHAFEFLVKHKLGAASSVERALKNLSDTQIITRAPEGWTLSNIVILRWIQWLYNKA